MAWLGTDPSDGTERELRRKGAAVIMAGLAVLAAVAVAVVLLANRGEEAAPAHRGEQRSTFASADGRIEAAVYRVSRVGDRTEVVLRPAGTTAAGDMVSFGCTADEDGLTIVAVTVGPDHIVARNRKGDERTIHFDPGTLRPESTLGSC